MTLTGMLNCGPIGRIESTDGRFALVRWDSKVAYPVRVVIADDLMPAPAPRYTALQYVSVSNVPAVPLDVCQIVLHPFLDVRSGEIVYTVDADGAGTYITLPESKIKGVVS